jgi:hypothetical protein
MSVNDLTEMIIGAAIEVLINFHVPLLKHGIKRMVLNHPE